jgi:hypothetical protein
MMFLIIEVLFYILFSISMFSYLLSAFALIALVLLFARLCTMCNRSLQWKIKG